MEEVGGTIECGTVNSEWGHGGDFFALTSIAQETGSRTPDEGSGQPPTREGSRKYSNLKLVFYQ
jgi:hypothetical protein